VFDPAAVKFLVGAFGASQILVGSDYPFNMGDPDPSGTLEKTGIDPAVIAGNARRFLGLPEGSR
jgi:aminocarboxymuconate-semialdehyde decarboxylase